MYKESELVKIKSIHKKLSSISTVVQRHGGIIKALEDEIEGQPAILMLLVTTAEQFNKLQENNSEILSNFDEKDLKGLASTRNFIAHDYDGIRLNIIADIIRYKLPIIYEITNNILKEQQSI